MVRLLGRANTKNRRPKSSSTLAFPDPHYRKTSFATPTTASVTAPTTYTTDLSRHVVVFANSQPTLGLDKESVRSSSSSHAVDQMDRNLPQSAPTPRTRRCPKTTANSPGAVQRGKKQTLKEFVDDGLISSNRAALLLGMNPDLSFQSFMSPKELRTHVEELKLYIQHDFDSDSYLNRPKSEPQRSPSRSTPGDTSQKSNEKSEAIAGASEIGIAELQEQFASALHNFQPSVEILYRNLANQGEGLSPPGRNETQDDDALESAHDNLSCESDDLSADKAMEAICSGYPGLIDGTSSKAPRSRGNSVTSSKAPKSRVNSMSSGKSHRTNSSKSGGDGGKGAQDTAAISTVRQYFRPLQINPVSPRQPKHKGKVALSPRSIRSPRVLPPRGGTKTAASFDRNKTIYTSINHNEAFRRTDEDSKKLADEAEMKEAEARAALLEAGVNHLESTPDNNSKESIESRSKKGNFWYQRKTRSPHAVDNRVEVLLRRSGTKECDDASFSSVASGNSLHSDSSRVLLAPTDIMVENREEPFASNEEMNINNAMRKTNEKAIPRTFEVTKPPVSRRSLEEANGKVKSTDWKTKYSAKQTALLGKISDGDERIVKNKSKQFARQNSTDSSVNSSRQRWDASGNHNTERRLLFELSDPSAKKGEQEQGNNSTTPRVVSLKQRLSNPIQKQLNDQTTRLLLSFSRSTRSGDNSSVESRTSSDSDSSCSSRSSDDDDFDDNEDDDEETDDSEMDDSETDDSFANSTFDEVSKRGSVYSNSKERKRGSSSSPSNLEVMLHAMNTDDRTTVSNQRDRVEGAGSMLSSHKFEMPDNLQHHYTLPPIDPPPNDDDDNVSIQSTISEASLGEVSATAAVVSPPISTFTEKHKSNSTTNNSHDPNDQTLYHQVRPGSPANSGKRRIMKLLARALG